MLLQAEPSLLQTHPSQLSDFDDCHDFFQRAAAPMMPFFQKSVNLETATQLEDLFGADSLPSPTTHNDAESRFNDTDLLDSSLFHPLPISEDSFFHGSSALGRDLESFDCAGI